MKDLSLWDEILFSLHYNDSISHNIFLTVSFVLAAIFAIIVFIYILYLLINSNLENRPKFTLKSFFTFATIGFWMVIFPGGLFLIVDVALTRDSDAAAFDKAILYELNGKPIALTIVEMFRAFSSDSGIVHGSSSYKIQAVDLEKGKLIFDKKLKSFTNSSYDKKILGTSKDNLFLFLDGHISVIDKASGETIRSVSSPTDSNDVSLLPSPEMCKFDKLTESIVFKANNGMVYSMDINNLNISEKKSIDTVKYFENDSQVTFMKYLEKGMTISKASESGKFNMFLTDSDINNLKEGLEVSRSSENTERRYLYNGNLDKVNELKKISPQVFLLGGFLFNEVSNDRFLYSIIDSKNKNYRNYDNILSRGESRAQEPFRLEGSNLSFIVHKKSLDPKAGILLTAIDLKDGKTSWTIDTGASEINECYRIDKDHILLFCMFEFNSMGGDANSNFIIYVSLKDGSCTGYDFKYGRSFKL
jgi:hypothetical protein